MAARALEEQIDIDRVRSLYGTAPLACAIGAFAGALWVLVFAATQGLAVMLGFFALVLANQATRLLLWHRQRAEPDDAARARVWARRYTWTMLSGGLIWGLGSLAFFPGDDPARQMFILVAAYGISSGATAPNAYHPPAMFAFLVATLLPVLARVFAEGGLIHGVIGVSLLIQIVVMILFGLGMSRQLRDSIRMRYENSRLIGELRDKTAVAEAAQRKAEQASLAKSQFFAAASHDLRQPMQALGLFAASLRAAKRDPEDARRIDQILSSVDTLESLFDELLDISKLDAGYVKPAPTHFTAKALFSRLETAYAPLARRSDLTLAFADAGAVLHTDGVLLERILGNLVANALRYTPAGSVRVSCRDAGERVVLAVADTGIGIPRDEQERVFDEFYQLGNPERDRRKGLGLGLATVKRMTQLLGCRVTLDSAPGRGSVFCVEVPKGDPARVAPASGEVNAEDVNALHGKLIAVVDDERDVREGLAELLGQWRCRPVAAASTAELLRQLGDQAPDAVIADYRLREHQTGVAAARALRERYGASLPVLVMSGDTTQEIFTAVREHRLPLLSKPVRAARLRAALLHLLSREPAAA